MAYALGSLDPSICRHLREVESLLVQIVDTGILSQVLIEHRLLTEDDREDIDKVTVFFISWYYVPLYQNYYNNCSLFINFS